MSIVKVEKWTGGIGLHPMGFFLLKTEAIQLAKDLLMACGISGAKYIVDLRDVPTPVHSGMSLDEIQDAANQLVKAPFDVADSRWLAKLVANLAARVKEQNDYPKLGSKFTCSCGQVWRWAKRI